ncbi:MAG: hypothetical protein GY832_10320 [Chloroflexi bacterium]|nr:hypothetical protein [Chloroflexota bacterium]
MVESDPKVRTMSYWFPTKASAERLFSMFTECSLNIHHKAHKSSFAEIVWSSGDVEQAISLFPAIVPEMTRREARRLFQPWPQGRYTTAYWRSGGILNLYTPPWGEPEDEVWADMLTGWQAQTFGSAGDRQDALRALEQRWNTTPHPFFAGLTPVQVMVGGGRQENELGREFLEQLTQIFDGQPFESEGQSLTETLILLRGWECQPGDDGQRPRDIIVAERNELLALRDRTLKLAREGQ